MVWRLTVSEVLHRFSLRKPFHDMVAFNSTGILFHQVNHRAVKKLKTITQSEINSNPAMSRILTCMKCNTSNSPSSPAGCPYSGCVSLCWCRVWRCSNTEEIVTYNLHECISPTAEEESAKEEWFLSHNGSSTSWGLWEGLGLSTSSLVTLQLSQWNKAIIHSPAAQERQDCLRDPVLPPVPQNADI